MITRIPAPAAAPVAGAQYLRFADAAGELGSSGAVSDVGSDQINLEIPDTTGATTDLAALVGAVFWDLGGTSEGNISCLLEWVAPIINNTSVVIAVWRAGSAPASLADIKAASAHWMQLLTRSATPTTSPYLKTGSSALGILNSAGLEGSVSISYTVGCDADGYGGSLSRHDGDGTSKTKTLTTVFTASGNFYLAVLWGKAVSAAAADETISFKLQGEFLQ